MNPRTLEGQLIAQGLRFGILVTRFNHFIVDRLLEGAMDTLRRHGVRAEDVQVFKVPGAWELPLLAKRVATSGKVDAIIALGAIIRGSTPHFDYVAAESSKGLAQVSLQMGIPITFGVLTTDSIEQAIERAGTKAGNKGAEAALSAIEMADLLKKMGAS